MPGTIIITGANGSLAIPAVKHILSKSSAYTLILTVRNPSTTDVNTKHLHDILAQFPHAQTSIRKLDLAHLSAVKEFANTVAAEIANGKLPPLASIVCNAYYWNLAGPPDLTADGYEKTFQVNHLAHAALVLRLLGGFAPDGGRIVLFSSDAHWPGKNGFEKYPPALPTDLNLLVKPAKDDPPDNMGRGFQRYAISKLVIVMWMYALNRHLEKDPKLSKITAVAINPGSLTDSRALRTNTPSMLYYLSLVLRPLEYYLGFLLRYMDPTIRSVTKAGVDVADLATGKASPGVRGYFTLSKEDVSAPGSLDEEKQGELWGRSLEWVGVGGGDTALALGG